MRCHLVLLLLIVSMTGCSTPWRGASVVTDQSGHHLCAKHRTPLRTERGYMDANPSCMLPSKNYSEALARYPNLWPDYISRTRFSSFTEPATATYCPECAEKALTFMRRLSRT
jgi:hypothetical protein